MADFSLDMNCFSSLILLYITPTLEKQYLVCKMFKNISLDSVWSGRTCPSNSDVQSCPARKLMPSPVEPYCTSDSTNVEFPHLRVHRPKSTWKPRQWKPGYAGTRCMTRLFLPVIFHFMFQGCTKTIPTLLGSGKITTTSTIVLQFLQ